MNYVFFGTPAFASTVLRKLLTAGFAPRAVVCAPDKPTGRKQIITPPPVKVEIQKAGVETEILQPEIIDALFLDKLRELKADFYVVAAYAKILSQNLIDIPSMGVIGVHPSLLPRFRGASPIQSVILEGEKETGVTLFLIDEKVDHGPIISFSRLEVGDKNYETLMNELAEISGELLVETLPKFMNKEIAAVPQNHDLASYTKKFVTEDAYIKPEKLETALGGNLEEAVKIERMVRALNPEPGVWSDRDGIRTKILEAKIVDNRLKLTKIQEAGKTPVFLP